MKEPIFRGTAPALVTPFTPDGGIDFEGLRRLVDFQIDGGLDYDGVEAVVVLGTTGENPTITEKERHTLVDTLIEHVDGRVKVIVGTGTNNTTQSMAFSKAAAEAGADGLLVVGPYYNKPTPDGLVTHVAAVAEVTDCPIVFYNVPGRTGSNATAETQLRLAEEIPSVVGTKEASGNLNQVADIIAGRPEGFAVYSGDDDLTLPMLALGADGLVSVIANAVPGATSKMVRLGLTRSFEDARELHFSLLRAMRASFFEANPGPIKTVLGAMGMIEETVRLPLVSPRADNRVRILDAYAPFIDAFRATPETNA